MVDEEGLLSSANTLRLLLLLRHMEWNEERKREMCGRESEEKERRDSPLFHI